VDNYLLVCLNIRVKQIFASTIDQENQENKRKGSLWQFAVNLILVSNH